VEDECGTCDSDPSNDCEQDCNGECGGSALLDACGICAGDGSTCAGIPVLLFFANVDINAGVMDIYKTNQSGCSYCTDPGFDNEVICELYGDDGDGNASWVFNASINESECLTLNGSWFDGSVGGFQFRLLSVTIDAATAPDGFTVSSTSMEVLGFSLSGATIPAGTGLLTQLNFTDEFLDTMCLEYLKTGDPSIDVPIISDAYGSGVNVAVGICYDPSCPYGYRDCTGVCKGPAGIVAPESENPSTSMDVELTVKPSGAVAASIVTDNNLNWNPPTEPSNQLPFKVKHSLSFIDALNTQEAFPSPSSP
jgi:hypothetical protein